MMVVPMLSAHSAVLAPARAASYYLPGTFELDPSLSRYSNYLNRIARRRDWDPSLQRHDHGDV